MLFMCASDYVVRQPDFQVAHFQLVSNPGFIERSTQQRTRSRTPSSLRFLVIQERPTTAQTRLATTRLNHSKLEQKPEQFLGTSHALGHSLHKQTSSFHRHVELTSSRSATMRRVALISIIAAWQCSALAPAKGKLVDKYCKEWADQKGGMRHGYQALPDALDYYLKQMTANCDNLE